MHSPEKALDAAEADEAADIDVVTGGDVVLLDPLGDGRSWLEEGVETEEGRPGGSGEGSCFAERKEEDRSLGWLIREKKKENGRKMNEESAIGTNDLS
jgi:hypothetical protein